MKKHILFYLILLNLYVSLAQNIQVDTNATIVIANGGLNLRSEPSKKSNKITNIPFGSTIKYLSDRSFNIDSIFIRHSHNADEELVKGNWVKVEYKKMKGYVLDVYLNHKPNYKERFNEKYENDFILLYPGCGCDAENLHNPNGWKWFGYFKEGEGKYKVEEISISYYQWFVKV